MINKTAIGLNMFLFVFILSCNDEFLELKPLTSISDVSVWSDLPLIEAYVNEIYAKIPHGYSSNLAAISDECYRLGSDYEVYNSGGANGGSMSAVNVWSKYYDIITDANNILDNIDDEKLDIDNPDDALLLDRIKGEAHFFRGYAYFKLLSYYGDVPLITKPFDLKDDFNIERTNYDEIFDFVIEEIDKASDLLPVNYNASNIGRITKGAARAIKSRVLLYRASPLWNPDNDVSLWNDAAEAAKAVIDMEEYSLVDDYSNIFDVADDSERIFWIKFDNKVSERHDLEQAWFPNGSAGRGWYHILQNAIDDFELVSGLLPENDPSFDPQDPYINRDPRFYDIVLFNGADWQNRKIETFTPKGDDSMESSSNAEAGSRTGYFVRKFIKEDIRNPTFSNVSNTPWIIIRYAEVLLNFAEANFQLGNEDICREYLNKIRNRSSVNMPDITQSGDELGNRLRRERRIELFMEEHRWFDLRRWKLAEEILTYDATKVDIHYDNEQDKLSFSYTTLEKRVFPDYYYLAPIPQSELEKNPNLSQNPGY